MKNVGLFDAKTRLSEICDEVAATHQPVTITKRGRPLVCIQPIESAVLTIRERRARYLVSHGKAEKPDRQDFEPAQRSTDVSDFNLGD